MISTRRNFMTAMVAFSSVAPVSAVARQKPTLHVLKDPGCGCCRVWVEILKDSGFEVIEEVSFGALLVQYKLANGVPPDMISCHTAKIDGYVIEGHVPVADIHRLLEERPDAVGLAVPGMPYGSPGMGPEDDREAYDVFLMKHDGGTAVFTSYQAA